MTKTPNHPGAGLPIQSSARSAKISPRWIFILLGLAVIPFIVHLVRRESAKRDDMALEAYSALRKSIAEHENTDPKDLTFTRDAGVFDYRGEQYSGTFTRPGGEVAKLKAWTQWFGNAKGTGYVVTWAAETPASKPAATGPAAGGGG